MNARVYLALVAVVWLAACGTPGAPRPPSLRLPRTVNDLAATRVGSTVTLTWTEPQLTTDGETIRALGPTLICMGVNNFPMTHCDEQVADLSQPQFASCAPKIGQTVTCAVALDPKLLLKTPISAATFAVEVLNTNDRSAGLSNQVQLPLVWTPPAATDVSAKVSADGILVGWDGGLTNSADPAEKFDYHVFRRESTGPEIDLGPPNTAAGVYCFHGCGFQYVDKSFEWEKTYSYRIVGIATVHLNGSEEQIQGVPSASVTVTARDIFPPAAPTGLQAVASGVGQPPFIDLTWAPNTESDLAGYNVYRHEEGQAAVKINAELVKAPAYRDNDVQHGHRYLYSVTAVDLRGNESGKSAEASETVQ